MAHKHSVYDTDNHFEIDGVTRAVKNASQTKTMLVQHDHNSERFTFELPRHIDGHDMSQCNRVQIHYINIDSKTAKTEEPLVQKGVYPVEDLQVSPEDEDVVIFSWLISRNATQLVGSLNFMIRFACIDDEGHVDYAWNTTTHTHISVSSGINADETYEEEYSDVLESWKASVMEELKEDLPEAFYDLTSPDGEGSVIRVRDTNGGKDVTFWIGTQAQYDMQSKKILNCIYIITDDFTVDKLKTKVDGIADHISYYWEDAEFRHFIREYNSGMKEGILQAVWSGLSFTTEHNGFYALDSGRQRVGLDALLHGLIPEFCSVNVSKATMTTASGEETFAPPIFAMVCGKPEKLDGYGVVSPRILLLADESAENVTVELEIHCRWKWNGGGNT